MSRKRKEEFGKFAILWLIVIVLLDQLTKIILPNYVKIVKNTGSAFGLFEDTSTLLVWFSIFIIGLLVYFFDEIPKARLAQFFYGLILGGVIGNLIDRIRLGYVIDFIDLKIWPVFNIADSAITIGVIGLIIYVYFANNIRKVRKSR